jgi:hypothetical protein
MHDASASSIPSCYWYWQSSGSHEPPHRYPSNRVYLRSSSCVVTFPAHSAGYLPGGEVGILIADIVCVSVNRTVLVQD